MPADAGYHGGYRGKSTVAPAGQDAVPGHWVEQEDHSIFGEGE